MTLVNDSYDVPLRMLQTPRFEAELREAFCEGRSRSGAARGHR